MMIAFEWSHVYSEFELFKLGRCLILCSSIYGSPLSSNITATGLLMSDA